MFSTLISKQSKPLSDHALYHFATGSLYYLQRLRLERKLSVHNGCVNTICWNDSGSLILSGSDDQHLVVSDPFSSKILTKFRSGHRSNIFSAKFLPGCSDNEIVSCSGAGEIFYTDIDREDLYGTNRFDCHFGTTYKLLVVPNETSTFLSCGDDGTVRFFDLRRKTHCSKFNCKEDVVIHLRSAVTAMAVDPIIPYQLAVAASDGVVRLYDRRMLTSSKYPGSLDNIICRMCGPMVDKEKRYYRITSLNYRPGSHDILVNYSSENIYLFNTYQLNMQKSYPASTSGVARSEPSKNGDSHGNAEGTLTRVASSSSSSDNGDDAENRYKPIKRLRLRGDWSDTGPDARPENEDPGGNNNTVQRMLDLLTRMLNSRSTREASQPTQEGLETSSTASVTASRNEESQAQTTDSGNAPSSNPLSSSLQEHQQYQDAGARLSISSEGLVSPELSSADTDGNLEEPSVRMAESTMSIEFPDKALKSGVEKSSQRECVEQSNMKSQETTLPENHSTTMDSGNMQSDNSIEKFHSALDREDMTLTAIEKMDSSVSITDMTGQESSFEDTSLSKSKDTSTETHDQCMSKMDVPFTVNNDGAKCNSRPPLEYESHEIISKHCCDHSLICCEQEMTEHSQTACKVDNKNETSCDLNVSPLRSDEIKTDSITPRNVQDNSIVEKGQNSACVSSSSHSSSTSISVASHFSTITSDPMDTVALASVTPSDGQKSQHTLRDVSSMSSELIIKELTPWAVMGGASSTQRQDGALKENVGDEDVPMVSHLQSSSKVLDGRSDLGEEDDKTLCEPKKPTDNEDNTICESKAELFEKDKTICEIRITGCEEDESLVEASQGNSHSTNSAQADKVESDIDTCKCKVGGEKQSSPKGKGLGKSTQRVECSICHKHRSSSYNHGRMQFAQNVDDKKASTSRAVASSATTPGFRSSNPSGQRRQRRTGYSLPPTGNFQLHSDHDDDDNDDDDDDDDDGERRESRQASHINRQKNDQRSIAARKIQEAFRKKQEAREAEARLGGLPEPRVLRKYSGHRNCRTMIKEANFYGDGFVISGSDCGRIMVWERETGQLVMYLDADHHVVNCVQPHPYFPVLASSGIDYDVKIWTPSAQDCQFDLEKAESIVHRNELMLEETRDTVTVPAAFMLRVRVLASLAQFRNQEQNNRGQGPSPEQD